MDGGDIVGDTSSTELPAYKTLDPASTLTDVDYIVSSQNLSSQKYDSTKSRPRSIELRIVTLIKSSIWILATRHGRTFLPFCS